MVKERFIYTVRLTFQGGDAYSVTADSVKAVVALAQQVLRQHRSLALADFAVDCIKQSPHEL